MNGKQAKLMRKIKADKKMTRKWNTLNGEVKAYFRVYFEEKKCH